MATANNNDELNTSDRAVEMLDSAIYGLSKVMRSPPINPRARPTVSENYTNLQTNIPNNRITVSNENSHSSLIESIAKTLKENQAEQREFLIQIRHDLHREIREQQEKQVSRLQRLESELRQRFEGHGHNNIDEIPRNISNHEQRPVFNRDHVTATSSSPNNNINNNGNPQVNDPNNSNPFNNQIPNNFNPFGGRAYVPRPGLVKSSLPTFEGLPTERPTRYIRELERFVRIAGIQEFELPMIIDQSLKGIAKEWWHYMVDKVDNWQEFTKEFLKYFWSETIQKKISNNLEKGWFRENNGVSRANYALRMIGNAKDITPPKSEEEIVNLVSRHFSRPIIESVLAQNITTVDKFLRLLDRWDNSAFENRPKFRASEQGQTFSTGLKDQPNSGNKYNQPTQRGNEYVNNPQANNARRFNNSPVLEKGAVKKEVNYRRPNTQHNVRAAQLVIDDEDSSSKPFQNPEEPCPEGWKYKETYEDNETHFQDNQRQEQIDEDCAGAICMMFPSVRHELMEGEEDDPPTRTMPKSPEVKIELQGISVIGLIDTGSTVTAISQEWYERNQQKLQDCPTLPTTGISIIGATGSKSLKIKRQIYLDVTIKTIRTSLPVLIVPGLIQDAILGMDLLQAIESSINLKANQWEIPENNETVEIAFEDTPSIKEYQRSADISLNEEEEAMSLNNEIDQRLSEVDLPMEKKEEIREVILNVPEIWRKYPGRVNCYEHELIITDPSQFVKRTYPIPLKFVDQAEEEIQRMLSQDIIRPSISPYINPMVPVIKKNGTLRLCLDARMLNKALQDDHEMSESVEEIFQRFTNTTYMTSLDLTNSFWQIPLTPESRKYTAFLFRGKCFEYVVTPFGLKTSSASLVRALRIVLSGLESFVINFIDDILCVSSSYEEHVFHLTILFNRLREHNLTLNLEKCQFMTKQIKFLGHILTSNGIMQDPSKIEAVSQFPTPKSVRQLRGFLGLINYYSKFTQNHASAIHPLLKLLKKEVKWKWESEHDKAFELTKKIFCEKVILKYPVPNQPFILSTDASFVAIGAALSQTDEEGLSHPIAFASRVLHGSELAYYTTEKELLSIVWALNKFRTYLLGAKVIIRTDHHALSFLMQSRFVSQRITRWILAIQDYAPVVEFCPGKQNLVADTLSRMHYHDSQTSHNKVPILTVLARDLSKTLVDILTNLKAHQERDPLVKSIKNGIETKDPRIISRYKTIAGLYYHRNNQDDWKCIIPRHVLYEFIKEIHEIYAHPGGEKCVKLISEDFYCPKLARLVRKIVATCDLCQRVKIINFPTATPLQSIIPKQPREIISVDFYGPLPKGYRGCQYIIVFEDLFSKYVAMYPMRKATVAATVNILKKQYIPQIGKPDKIITDHGTQFTAKRWKETLKELGIIHILSSVRHPQSNPVERVNREIGRMFRTLIKSKHNEWVKWVPIIENCCNEVWHSSTGYTPVEIMFNKTPTRPWKKWIKNTVNNETNANPANLKLLLAKETMQKRAKERARKNKLNSNYKTYSIGDLILLRANHISKNAEREIAKFFALYEGPYIIRKQKGPATFEIDNLTTGKIRGTFHTSLFRPYHSQYVPEKPHDVTQRDPSEETAE